MRKVAGELDRLELSKERQVFDEYLQKNKEFEEFAKRFGISNLYKDSNLQQLQQALYLGLTFQPSRQSVDATDYNGHDWELKSLNINNQTKSFSTANPLTHNVIDRYRKCKFAFSLYDNTCLKKIYVMNPSDLECYFSKWEDSLRFKCFLNNPNISLRYVEQNGFLVYNSDFSPYVVDPVPLLNLIDELENIPDESVS